MRRDRDMSPEEEILARPWRQDQLLSRTSRPAAPTKRTRVDSAASPDHSDAFHVVLTLRSTLASSSADCSQQQTLSPAEADPEELPTGDSNADPAENEEHRQAADNEPLPAEVAEPSRAEVMETFAGQPAPSQPAPSSAPDTTEAEAERDDNEIAATEPAATEPAATGSSANAAQASDSEAHGLILSTGPDKDHLMLFCVFWKCVLF